MTQFGAGPLFAAQCPIAPAPVGYRLWVDALDGPVPDVLARAAADLAADSSVPVGATTNYALPGVVVLLRVEPHVWGPDGAGKLVAGCFRACGVYVPVVPGDPSVQPPTVVRESPWTRTAAILTVFTIAGGILASLVPWGAPKRR